MTLGPHIRSAEDAVIAKLALQGEEVLSGIRYAILVKEGRRSGDRQELRPIYGIIGVARGSVVRRKNYRKALALRVAGRSIDERRGELRRHRAGIEESKGRVTNLDKAG